MAPTGLAVSSSFGSTYSSLWLAPLSGTPTGYVFEAGLTVGGVLASLPTNSTAPSFTGVYQCL